MGGGKSRVQYRQKIVEKIIEKVEYKVPPEIQKKLEQLQLEKKNPKNAIKADQQMKALICSELQKTSFPTNFGQKRIVLLGRTSTGKSSLINKLFGTKLKVAAGRCTSEIHLAYEVKGVKIYDVPGFDNKFNLTLNLDLIISALGSINIAYVLFESVTDVEDLIRYLVAMKRQVFGVRTKCDTIDQDCEFTFDQELARDREEFRRLGIENPIIFGCSKKGGFDNEKLLLHMVQ